MADNSNAASNAFKFWRTLVSLNSTTPEVAIMPREPLQEESPANCQNIITVGHPETSTAQSTQTLEISGAPSPGSKRKLKLSLPLQPSVCESDELTSATPIKSSKIMTPEPSVRHWDWSRPKCIICIEDLFSYDDTDSENSSSLTSPDQEGVRNFKPILSTKCGHLFHTRCINQWFMENKEKEIKECPYCKREMMSNDTTRIFAVFGDGD